MAVSYVTRQYVRDECGHGYVTLLRNAVIVVASCCAFCYLSYLTFRRKAKRSQAEELVQAIM